MLFVVFTFALMVASINQITSVSIGAWDVKLEIITERPSDRPNNRPTDGQTGSRGSFTSNKIIWRRSHFGSGARSAKKCCPFIKNDICINF